MNLQTFTLWLAFIGFSLNWELAEASKRRVNFQPVYMPADEVISYFKSFFLKTSSLDRANEEFYMQPDYADDLFNKVDNFMPLPHFLQWLVRTKDITDKTAGGDKKSLLPKYASTLNAPCNESSVFNLTINQILQTWDGERTIVANELETWQKQNDKVPPAQLCNRFKGLTCQHKLSLDPEADRGMMFMPIENTSCQCAGNPAYVGYYWDTSEAASKRDPNVQGTPYPDGCYIRPWSPCRHLSGVDIPFKSMYHDYHMDLDSERRVLAQMVFPLPRTHRCRQGTYCLDMIPGMKKPICWCTPSSKDPACHEVISHNSTGMKQKIPPLNSDLLQTRFRFMKMMIAANDTKSQCSPELNGKVKRLADTAGKEPFRTGAYDIIKEIVEGKHLRFCDFREAIYCDQKTRVCKGNLNCGPGKVHLGKGVCAINNGFACQSNEDCVPNAQCKYFKEMSESACTCMSGYGDGCHLENKPFFGSRFLPLISGLRDDEFLKKQVEVFKILEAWEDAMIRKAGESCDKSLDVDSMQLVKFFGNLNQYDKDSAEGLLTKAIRISKESNGQLCNYRDFLRCEKGKCMPMFGRRIVSTGSHVGDNKIVVELDHNDECVPSLPKIFDEKVRAGCKQGYMCKYNGMKKVCEPDCDSQYAPVKDCQQQKAKRAAAAVSGAQAESVLVRMSGRNDFDSLGQMRAGGSLGGRADGDNGTIAGNVTGNATGTAPGNGTGTAPAGTGGNGTLLPVPGGGNTTIVNMTMGNMGNMTVGNMTLGNMTMGNMTLGNMTMGNMTMGNMTLGNMTMGNMTDLMTDLMGNGTFIVNGTNGTEPHLPPPFPGPGDLGPMEPPGPIGPIQEKLSYGKPCGSSSDCDKSYFLECRGGKCSCPHGLTRGEPESLAIVEHKPNPEGREMPIMQKVKCVTPFDGLCDEEITLQRDFGEKPACYPGTHCQEINGRKFCRPLKEGGIFVPKKDIENLKRMYGYNGATPGLMTYASSTIPGLLISLLASFVIN